MNLDELQSVQARERQSSDLQHLRSSFYREVGDFIAGLNDERARVVEAADDPFSEPEVSRLSNDIETAEGTIEAIYERRVGKVVKKASIAAAGMPVEEDGLTNEEESLFIDLVTRIEANRDTVLSALAGETTTVSCSIDDRQDDAVVGSRSEDTDTAGAETEDVTASPSVDNSAEEDGVSAADLMGSEADPSTDLSVSGSPSANTDAPTPPPTSERNGPPFEEISPDTGTATDDSNSDSERGDVPGLPRTTVRITANVGQIVGVDDRDYELAPEDVVTLPEQNADVLVEKNAAERL